VTRVGVVGVTGFGRHHAEAFAALGCEVAAVAAAGDGVEAAAARHGARAYRDYRDLLRHPGLDAVSFSLPPRLHPDAVRAAVAAGLPVLCEKPVAPDAAIAARLLADLGPDAPVAVGFCFRYHAAYRRLRELIREGALGRVRSVHARKCWGTRSAWRLEPGGGAVFVKDIHYYDLVPWLLDDEPLDLAAFGGAFYHPGPVEDSYQLLLRFRGGAVFHLDSAWWTLPGGASRFEVVGERARVVVDDEGLRLTGDGGREERAPGEPMLLAEVRAFLDWLRGGGPRPPGLAEAARANALAQRVVDALRGPPGATPGGGPS
jgi:myo-inositol 2-dehydrogenase/D-chiro-inositol 1-dehydrogenase